MKILARTVIVFTLFFQGCGESNRYEMTKDSSGRTVRLDKKTGEMAVMENDQIAVLKNRKEIEQDAKKIIPLNTPKEWPAFSIPQLGDLHLTLTTLWRDNRLAYQLFVFPYSKKLETEIKKTYSSFGLNIEFYDTNGFKVATINLPIRQFTRNLSEKGETVGISANDSISMSSSSYTQISSWNVLWYGGE